MSLNHIIKNLIIIIALFLAFPFFITSSKEVKGEVITEQNTYVSYINSTSDSYINLIESQSFILPVNGIITSAFNDKTDRESAHKGTDIAVETGTPVMAAEKGIVEEAKYSSSYGYYVKIRHSNNLYTIYAHNSKLLVEKGDYVRKGEFIALSGSTGNSTGPHVHFEIIKNGENVDPMSICSKIN